jgi:proteasome assembly chaperone (PAC2) family protein
MGKLVLTKKPQLHAPYLVAGFAGWPDGGGVSTGVVDFLTSYLAAEPIGEITSDGLYTYTSPAMASRPIVTIQQGVLQSLHFPANEFYGWQSQGVAPDLVLLQGIEPDLHWQQFTEAVLECVQVLDVQRVYTIGGYLDHAPHTRVPRLSAMVTHATLLEELLAYDLDLADYEGPTSIQSYLLSHCQDQGIEGIGLWGGTPSYIQGTYPKVAHTMLSLLSQIWQLPLELSMFEEQTAELESSLHEQIDSSPELAEYIKHLEQAYDLAEPDTPGPRTDTMVDEIQQFLRRRRDQPRGDDERPS